MFTCTHFHKHIPNLVKARVGTLTLSYLNSGRAAVMGCKESHVTKRLTLSVFTFTFIEVTLRRPVSFHGNLKLF